MFPIRKRARFRSSLLLLSALVAAAFYSEVTSAAPTTDDTAARATNALTQLQRFKQSKIIDEVNSLADLRSAIYTLQSAIDVRTLTPKNFITQRRSMVENWAQVLRAIEQSYDPAFKSLNDDDIPTTCVIPPERLPCGSSPNSVRDPHARAAYVANLKANALKTKRAAYYQQLHSLDEGAMSILETTLQLFNKVAPENVGPDFAALDNILRQAGISDTRRQTLDSWIYPRSSP